MRYAYVLALLVVLGASSIESDDSKVNLPYEWKLTGDNAEDAKVSLVVNQKVDQSTARGVVEAWLRFTGPSYDTDTAEVRLRWSTACGLRRRSAPLCFIQNRAPRSNAAVSFPPRC